jgi:hypothetical protein
MSAETVPASVNTDGNLTIWWIPGTTGNPLSKAVIEAGTSKLITYSLTGDGWNHGTDETVIEDVRLTLAQTLQELGRVTDTLELKYVFGDTGDIARAALTQNTRGWFVVRYAKANDTTVTVGDIVDVLPVRLGVQRKTAPTANSQFTIMQKVVVKGNVIRDGVVVA